MLPVWVQHQTDSDESHVTDIVWFQHSGVCIAKKWWLMSLKPRRSERHRSFSMGGVTGQFKRNIFFLRLLYVHVTSRYLIFVIISLRTSDYLCFLYRFYPRYQTWNLIFCKKKRPFPADFFTNKAVSKRRSHLCICFTPRASGLRQNRWALPQLAAQHTCFSTPCSTRVLSPGSGPIRPNKTAGC